MISLVKVHQTTEKKSKGLFNSNMDDKIKVTLKYYFQQRQELLNFVNNNNNLSTDEIIEKGEQLGVLEYKITALQVALEN